MPRVYKIRRFDKVNNIKDSDIYKYVYNTSTWRKIRLNYLSDHPLCEMCCQFGYVVSAEHVHHKVPISKGRNIIDMQGLGFDSNNLMSVCEKCHKNIHKHKI